MYGHGRLEPLSLVVTHLSLCRTLLLCAVVLAVLSATPAVLNMSTPLLSALLLFLSGMIVSVVSDPESPFDVVC